MTHSLLCNLSLYSTCWHDALFCLLLQDAMKAVTRTAVREARLKEIRQEILASEKLKVHIFVLSLFLFV